MLVEQPYAEAVGHQHEDAAGLDHRETTFGTVDNGGKPQARACSLHCRPLLVAYRHRGVDHAPCEPALLHERSPILEQHLERTPHRHPADDNQPFAKDLSYVNAGYRDRELASEKDGEHNQAHEQVKMPTPQVLA
jgi:hypothetical protein